MPQNRTPEENIRLFPYNDLAARILNLLNRYEIEGMPENIETECSDGEVLTAEILKYIKGSALYG